jgi:hypothetical protein
MGRPRKYETEADRKQAYMLAQNKYSKKKTVCDVCQLTYNLGNKTSHLKSFTHNKFFEQDNSTPKM